MVFWHVKEKKGEKAVEREQRLYIEKAADIIRESACASVPLIEMEKAAKKYRHGGEPDAAKMAELFGMSVIEVVRREKELGLLD